MELWSYGVFLKENIVNIFWLHWWDKIDAMIMSDCRNNQLKKVAILDIILQLKVFKLL